MSKPEPKKAARSRSAEEMNSALSALSQWQDETSVPPHYDKPVDILRDAINELLELRQLRADVLAFVQTQQAKLSRR